MSVAPQQDLNHIDVVVNQQSLRHHLVLLRQFKALEIDDSFQDLVYLSKAESRYQKWLELIVRMQLSTTSDDFPAPPIDVALMWHAHMLSPYRYYEDGLRLARVALENPSTTAPLIGCVFPLEKLYNISTSNPDPRSVDFWETNTKEPYVLSREGLLDQSHTFHCPWCSIDFAVKIEDWVKVKTRKAAFITCQGCDAICSANTLSGKRFLDDLGRYYADRTRNFLAGTSIQLKDGQQGTVDQEKDHVTLFDINKSLWQAQIAKGATNSKECEWAKIINIIRKVVIKLKTDRVLKNLRKETISRIRTSYMGIIPSHFSINLIPAVIRQRDFTAKMMHNSWDNPQVLSLSIARYRKFLLLITENPGKIIVPTLNIDLAWHTHLLHPNRYRDLTHKQTGRVINHDDTIDTPKLNKALVKTSKLWHKKFNEPYTSDDLSRIHVANNPIVSGLLFFFYGIKSRELKMGWERDNIRPMDYSKEPGQDTGDGPTSGICDVAFEGYYSTAIGMGRINGGESGGCGEGGCGGGCGGGGCGGGCGVISC